MECSKYAEERGKLFGNVNLILGGSGINFLRLPTYEQLCVLLGGRSGNPDKDDRVDIVVTRFLRKAWKKRSQITRAVNNILNRNDNIRY
jgi:hypothetical protein